MAFVLLILQRSLEVFLQCLVCLPLSCAVYTSNSRKAHSLPLQKVPCGCLSNNLCSGPLQDATLLLPEGVKDQYTTSSDHLPLHLYSITNAYVIYSYCMCVCRFERYLWHVHLCISLYDIIIHPVFLRGIATESSQAYQTLSSHPAKSRTFFSLSRRRDRERPRSCHHQSRGFWSLFGAVVWWNSPWKINGCNLKSSICKGNQLPPTAMTLCSMLSFV